MTNAATLDDRREAVEQPLKYLQWDSDFFGKKICRITRSTLDPATLDPMFQWCRANAIDCLYFLCEALDGDSVRLAEKNGFCFVDIRLTFERILQNTAIEVKADPRFNIRYSLLEDIPALRSIAKISFRDSRFYFDPQFPDALCDELYEIWIEKSCKGYANTVIVAEAQGIPAGFITCNLAEPEFGEIGLVGVSPNSQGFGLGQRLVNEALCWFASQGAQKVIVVTQGRNVKAQRLYQRSGFLTRSLQLWYHKWFTNKEVG